MKFIYIALLLLGYSAQAQQNEGPLKFSGFYSAQIGTAPGNISYTYLRFYVDGSVIMHADSSGVIDSVKTTFKKNGSYLCSGTYVLNGDAIRIELNQKSPEQLSNPILLPLVYNGLVFQSNAMKLLRSEMEEQAWFDFFEVN